MNTGTNSGRNRRACWRDDCARNFPMTLMCTSRNGCRWLRQYWRPPGSMEIFAPWAAPPYSNTQTVTPTPTPTPIGNARQQRDSNASGTPPGHQRQRRRNPEVNYQTAPDTAFSAPNTIDEGVSFCGGLRNTIASSRKGDERGGSPGSVPLRY